MEPNLFQRMKRAFYGYRASLVEKKMHQHPAERAELKTEQMNRIAKYEALRKSHGDESAEPIKRGLDFGRAAQLEREMQQHPAERAELKAMQMKRVIKYEALRKRQGRAQAQESQSIQPTGLGLKAGRKL